ncbi:MAG: MerR family transcriptional regulator [Nitrospirales bacterium]|jgi:DNA-binding transcriptional MerR regulator
MGAGTKYGEKEFYKIGEVASLTKLPAYVLRFWESEFIFLKPKKSQGKHRVYSKSDIETVFEIKRMLYEEGYTLAGLKRYWYRKKRGGQVVQVHKDRVGKAKAELKGILKILDRELV